MGQTRKLCPQHPLDFGDRFGWRIIVPLAQFRQLGKAISRVKNIGTEFSSAFFDRKEPPDDEKK